MCFFPRKLFRKIVFAFAIYTETINLLEDLTLLEILKYTNAHKQSITFVTKSMFEKGIIIMATVSNKSLNAGIFQFPVSNNRQIVKELHTRVRSLNSVHTARPAASNG